MRTMRQQVHLDIPPSSPAYQQGDDLSAYGAYLLASVLPDFLLLEQIRKDREENKMRKRADGGVANDLAGEALYGGLGVPVGSFIGWLAGKPSKERLQKWDEHPGLSWLPGVGSYRIMRKTLDTMGPEGEKTKRVRSRLLSETLGQGTSAALLALALGGAGAGIGAALGGRDAARVFGLSGVGAGLYGAAMANVIGSLVGTTRKRRTENEQAVADQKGQAAAWLVPGVGAYRSARRLPSLTSREDMRNQAREDANRDEKA